jgi:hypothetical protein
MSRRTKPHSDRHDWFVIGYMGVSSLVLSVLITLYL